MLKKERVRFNCFQQKMSNELVKKTMHMSNFMKYASVAAAQELPDPSQNIIECNLK